MSTAIRNGLPTSLIVFILFFTRCELISEEQLYDIDLMIDEVLKCRRVPGVSLAIVSGDDIVTRGYGLADIAAQREVDENTIFCIGSVGKAFTSTLIAMEIDKRGNLSWDTRVKDLIPDFQLRDPVRTSETTLRDILAHRTGLQSGDMVLQSGTGLSKEDIVRELRFLNEETSFRGKFVYNNLMYVLAGYIAEIMEGESFTKLIREKIFQPLNMSTAIFVTELDDFLGQIAKPYTLIGGELVELDLISVRAIGEYSPAGGICASANDMGRWLHFLLTGGRDTRGNYLVKERLLKDTMQEQMVLYGGLFSRKLKPRFPISEINIAYGMGWVTSNYRGYSRVDHSGSLWGYSSHVWLFLNEKFGVFIGVNGPAGDGASRARETILAYISDLLLSEEPWLNISTACSYPKPWEIYPELRYNITNIIYHGPLKRNLLSYTGQYYHPLYGNAEIRRDNSSSAQLQLMVGEIYSGKLYTLHTVDTFLMVFDGVYEFLTISDDKQEIGSVAFNTSGGVNDGKTIRAESFVLAFLDGSQYEFQKNNGHISQGQTDGCSIVSARGMILLLAVVISWVAVFHKECLCSDS